MVLYIQMLFHNYSIIHIQNYSIIHIPIAVVIYYTLLLTITTMSVSVLPSEMSEGIFGNEK